MLALKDLLSKKNVEQTVNLVIFVESAIGLLNLREICQKAVEMCDDSTLRLDGIVFGSDDFCADIGW